MSEVGVPCLGSPCRVADCARAAPGRQALASRRSRRNRKQTVPWICGLVCSGSQRHVELKLGGVLVVPAWKQGPSAQSRSSTTTELKQSTPLFHETQSASLGNDIAVVIT